MNRPKRPVLERYDFQRVENMWMPLVVDVIGDFLERWEMCDCADCAIDVAALALNSLPPKYWVLGGFDVFGSPEAFRNDPENRRMAEQAVIKALRLVEQNPHH
jgi:competence protein ComFB